MESQRRFMYKYKGASFNIVKMSSHLRKSVTPIISIYVLLAVSYSCGSFFLPKCYYRERLDVFWYYSVLVLDGYGLGSNTSMSSSSSSSHCLCWMFWTLVCMVWFWWCNFSLTISISVRVSWSPLLYVTFVDTTMRRKLGQSITFSCENIWSK